MAPALPPLADVPLRRLAEFLEGPDLARRAFQAALRRPGDLGDVDVSPRVDHHAVWGGELARLLARELSPEARHALALGVEHGDARADVRCVVGHGDRRPQLADVEQVALPPVGVEPA